MCCKVNAIPVEQFVDIVWINIKMKKATPLLFSDIAFSKS
jgi:hypothetical protein